MDAVILHQTGRDLGEKRFPEKRLQMHPQPVPMVLDIFRVAFPGREGGIFLPKLVSCGFETPAGLQLTGTELPFEAEKPILSDVLGPFEALLAGAGAEILPVHGGRALPVAAPLAPVDMQFAIEKLVMGRHRTTSRHCATPQAKVCKKCVGIFVTISVTQVIEITMEFR